VDVIAVQCLYLRVMSLHSHFVSERFLRRTVIEENIHDFRYDHDINQIRVSVYEVWIKGRSIAQAVSRWLPTVTARVRARVCSSGICGGQSDAGASTSVSPADLHSTKFSFLTISRGGYNRPVWTPPPTMRIKKKVWMNDYGVDLDRFTNTSITMNCAYCVREGSK
jgi:hypothetical protein